MEAQLKPPVWDAVIVGAGIAGLAARQLLLARGKSVLTLEKSRGLGGRMSTRRLDPDSMADLGAQSVSAKNDDFRVFLERSGAIRVLQWTTPTSAQYAHPRGMSQVAKGLVDSFHSETLLKSTRVTRIQQSLEKVWTIQAESSGTIQNYQTRSIILTAPLPQSLELLEQSAVPLDPVQKTLLGSIHYESSIAVVFAGEPDRPWSVPLRDLPADLFIQREKGLQTRRPTFVLYLRSQLSELMWNEDVENIARFAWSKVVRDHVLAPPMPEAQVHRWKFSEPKKKLPDPYYNCSSQESGSISGLVLAGDAFSGEGIEGAYFSGIAAAKSVLDEY